MSVVICHPDQFYFLIKRKLSERPILSFMASMREPMNDTIVSSYLVWVLLHDLYKLRELFALLPHRFNTLLERNCFFVSPNFGQFPFCWAFPVFLQFCILIFVHKVQGFPLAFFDDFLRAEIQLDLLRYLLPNLHCVFAFETLVLFSPKVDKETLPLVCQLVIGQFAFNFPFGLSWHFWIFCGHLYSFIISLMSSNWKITLQLSAGPAELKLFPCWSS